MQNLISVVKSLTDLLNTDVSSQVKSPSFQSAFRQYIYHLEPALNRYQHHRSLSVADEEQLIYRFQAETALLHAVTEILQTVASSDFPHMSFPFPCQNDSVFGWYQISIDVKNKLKEVISLPKTDIGILALDLSELSGQLLSEFTSRTTGEFYTPRALAEHLIEISGLSASDILDGKLVVDPSCGGGIILLSIVVPLVRSVLNDGAVAQDALVSITENIYGFDIQPFAIALCQTLLLAACIPLYVGIPSDTKFIKFDHICLTDPLADLADNSGALFDYVIGNPPYLPAKRDYIDYIKRYEGIIDGHVNLYALFLWWSFQACTENGIVAFLVPQTLLGGAYFQKLRTALSEHMFFKAITRMTDRKGVIGDADQQVMAICLQRAPDGTSIPDIEVILTHNGENMASHKPTSVSYRQIVKYIQDKPIWVVSDKLIDYEIAELIENYVSTTLGDLKPDLLCQNGGFVWNQHKSIIMPKARVNALPLVSASAIDPFVFTFPYPSSNPHSKRAFVRSEKQSDEKIYSQRAVLLQRITSRKTGRRLIATITSDAFHAKYPRFFIENHVNAITSQDEELLYGILAWLNSDVAQFIFQMRNGNSQVSVYELLSLPVSLDLLLCLAPLSKTIIEANERSRSHLINDLNQSLHQYFGLNDPQQSRIFEVLKRKESGNS